MAEKKSDQHYPGNPSAEQKEHGDKAMLKANHDLLVKKVAEAIGEEKITALCKQPLAIANGGREAILERACKEAAGFPEPVAAAVAKFRVLCGSSAVPKVKAED